MMILRLGLLSALLSSGIGLSATLVLVGCGGGNGSPTTTITSTTNNATPSNISVIVSPKLAAVVATSQTQQFPGHGDRRCQEPRGHMERGRCKRGNAAGTNHTRQRARVRTQWQLPALLTVRRVTRPASLLLIFPGSSLTTTICHEMARTYRSTR